GLRSGFRSGTLAADASRVAISRQSSNSRGYRFHTAVHRRQSFHEPPEIIGAVMRIMAMEAGQWGALRYDLPRSSADAAPRRRDRTARDSSDLAQSVRTKKQAATDPDRHDATDRRAH